jgi:hypothetical protein
LLVVLECNNPYKELLFGYFMENESFMKRIVDGGVEGLVSAAEVISTTTGFPFMTPYHKNSETQAGQNVYAGVAGLVMGTFMTATYLGCMC